jgi:hypothetical protein
VKVPFGTAPPTPEGGSDMVGTDPKSCALMRSRNFGKDGPLSVKL